MKYTVPEYIKKFGREPTAKIRIKCPMCGMNVKSSRFDRIDPGKIKIWLQFYMGRGNIQFVEMKPSNKMFDQLKEQIILKCKAILYSLGHTESMIKPSFIESVAPSEKVISMPTEVVYSGDRV